MKKNKKSIIFKLFLFATSFVGILIQTGILEGEFNYHIFNYYTLISNLLCMIYFLLDAVYLSKKNKTLFPKFKGVLTMGIVVTGIVFHFLLSKTLFDMGTTYKISNILLHYVVPIGAILDYLLFDKKGTYNYKSPFLWVLLPDLYYVYVLVGRLFNIDFSIDTVSNFPYYFIDYELIGINKVIMYVLILNVAFIALGYVFVLIDNILKKK